MKQYLIELPNEEYQVIDEDELKQIEKSAKESYRLTGMRVVTELPLKKNIPHVNQQRTEMKVENLKYLLRYGQEAMTVMQVADALKEAHDLIQKAEKMEQLLRDIQLYETDSNDAWVTNVLKMVDEALR